MHDYLFKKAFNLVSNSKVLEKSAEFSSGYYADFKAKHFPLSIVFKARKL